MTIVVPIMTCPQGSCDGGYAVSDFREIDPQVGTLDDLNRLAAEMQQREILLVLDVVVNHTSNRHYWAQQAQAGNREYQQFYYIFPDRTLPDQYERTLREIFPTVRHGNFIWHDGLKQWVWTTFNSYQWDLN